MRLAWLVLGLVACGDNRGGASSDAASPPVPGFTSGCRREVVDESAYTTPEQLGEIVPGTLAGWDPDGRWFFTDASPPGIRATQSIHFERRGADVIVDRDDTPNATMTEDMLYRRFQVEEIGRTWTHVMRIANRASDGTLRADLVACSPLTSGKSACEVCTARLVRAERFDPNPSEKLTLVGELTGTGSLSAANVRVIGNFAYLVRFRALDIIDITDPAHPVARGRYTPAGNAYLNDVKLVEGPGGRRYAILADTPVHIVDVTDPDAPVLAGQILETAHTLFVEGTTAYFANDDATAAAYDVTVPTAPVRLGRYVPKDAFNVHDLSVANGIAYLNAMGLGFLVVDFTTPSAPLLKGMWETPGASHSNWTTTAGGRKIAVHGDEGYGAHIDIVDIDPASPTYMQPFASYKTRDFVSVHNIMAIGEKAYFTYYQDGVRVLDLADPANPKLVGYYNTWDPQAETSSNLLYEGAIGIDVDPVRKLIFVADTVRGLLILRDDT